MALLKLNRDVMIQKYGIRAFHGAHHVVIKCKRGHKTRMKIMCKIFFFDCQRCKKIESEIFGCEMREH